MQVFNTQNRFAVLSDGNLQKSKTSVKKEYSLNSESKKFKEKTLDKKQKESFYRIIKKYSKKIPAEMRSDVKKKAVNYLATSISIDSFETRKEDLRKKLNEVVQEIQKAKEEEAAKQLKLKKYFDEIGRGLGGNPDGYEDLDKESKSALSRCWKGLIDTVSGFGYLGIAVYYNLLRDPSWTYVTDDNYNDRLRTADNWNEANYGQWAWGTIFMFGGLALHWLACKIAGKEMPWKKSLVAIAAASMAIPGWNWAGYQGQALGESLGMTSDVAGYFAAIFTGLAEGPIQEAMTTLGNFLSDSEERKKFKSDPKEYLKDFAKRFGLSITLGAIPGDVWQLVYNACQTNNANIFLTSLAVGLAVATCNVGYAKIVDKIFASKCCKKTLSKSDSMEYLSKAYQQDDIKNDDDKGKKKVPLGGRDAAQNYGSVDSSSSSSSSSDDSYTLDVKTPEFYTKSTLVQPSASSSASSLDSASASSSNFSGNKDNLSSAKGKNNNPKGYFSSEEKYTYLDPLLTPVTPTTSRSDNLVAIDNFVSSGGGNVIPDDVRNRLDSIQQNRTSASAIVNISKNNQTVVTQQSSSSNSSSSTPPCKKSSVARQLTFT